jgi:uncharacterized protein (TIGR03437 family)
LYLDGAHLIAMATNFGGASGAGDGAVTAVADPNSDTSLRGAVLSLNNGPVHSIYQDGNGSLLALSPLKASTCGSPTASFGLSWAAPGNIELHLNSPTGPVAGQFGASGTALVSGITDGTQIFMTQNVGSSGPGTLASARATVIPSDCKVPGIAPLGAVNAASFVADSVAPGSLATVFGSNLSTATAQTAGSSYPTILAGTSVTLGGQASQLWYVSPGQINFLVPANMTPGRYILNIGTASSEILVTSVSPGIFTLKGNGTGVPLAAVTGVLSDGSTVSLPPYQCSNAGCAAVPMVLPGDLTDLYLVRYGTGIRNYQTISATLGSVRAEVVYVGAQGQFPGLDQVNLHLKGPIGLSGTQSLRLRVDGTDSNSFSLQFP